LKLTELYSQAALSTLNANSMRAKGFGENSVNETSSSAKSKEISTSETSSSFHLSDSDAVSVNISSAAQKYFELSNEFSKPLSLNNSSRNDTAKQGLNSLSSINLIA